jgi:hypothetical protein
VKFPGAPEHERLPLERSPWRVAQKWHRDLSDFRWYPCCQTALVDPCDKDRSAALDWEVRMQKRDKVTAP